MLCVCGRYNLLISVYYVIDLTLIVQLSQFDILPCMHARKCNVLVIRFHIKMHVAPTPNPKYSGWSWELALL